jgi:heptosyltransferase-2
LILKAGYTETFLDERGMEKVSLGDVFRTTPLLHAYEGEEVTWVADEEAAPLLEDNRYIERLMVFNWLTASQLQSEEFDVCVNLEKVPGICAISHKIDAYDRFGFRLDKRTGEAEAYGRAQDILAASSQLELRRGNNRTLQKILFEMVGKEWKGEEYILGYEPPTKEEYDIGFNTQVGKAWPMEKWEELEKIIGAGFSISRQEDQRQTKDDLRKYIDWLNSCRLVISNDSLGLHLALTLRKKVLGLFGPSNPDEIYFYGRGDPILPDEDFECTRCCKYECDNPIFCMDHLSPERVYEKIESMLEN